MEQKFRLPTKCQAAFLDHESILYLKDSIEVLAEASYSASQTIGAYLCYAFHGLAPPGCQENWEGDSDENFPSAHLTSSLYFEPWCDYLTKMHWELGLGEVIKYETTICYICRVSPEFYSKVKKMNPTILVEDTHESFLETHAK